MVIESGCKEKTSCFNKYVSNSKNVLNRFLLKNTFFTIDECISFDDAGLSTHSETQYHIANNYLFKTTFRVYYQTPSRLKLFLKDCNFEDNL